MSRDNGFEVGDRSTRTLYDPRVIKAQRLGGFVAVVAWDALVDASWAAGCRVTLADALLPLPYRIPTAKVREALQQAGLIDDEDCVRDGPWQTWFRPAFNRREAKRKRDRERGQRGHDERWRRDNEPPLSDSDAPPIDSEPLADRERVDSGAASDTSVHRLAPIRPSVRPSVPSDSLEHAAARGQQSVSSRGGVPERMGDVLPRAIR